jgi:metal-responsive CopG/Arc/MetJ family transcriptional regulator
LKHNLSISIDVRLFREIEELRGLATRSRLYEELLKEGLKTYRCKERAAVARAVDASWRR